MLRVLPFVLVLVLSVYCLVDSISTRGDRVRNLAKHWWVLVILLVPLAGSIAWLVAGRPRKGAVGPAPADHEAYLRQVRERAELQRFRYRQQQKRRKKEDPDGGDSAA